VTAVPERGQSSDRIMHRVWPWHKRLAPSNTSSAPLGLGRVFERFSSMRLALPSLPGARVARRATRGPASFCKRTVTPIFPCTG